ncbi:MAG: homocysteine S-methyltransferase family protein [Eubacteriales bacterium]|jgi:5-methyltetrahydrofolate--homocysteine methyltransferase
MNITEKLNRGFVIFDGGMGTMLQTRGLSAGELPETWNVTRPEVMTEIHREYIRAGAEVVTANTFGANRLKYRNGSGKFCLENIIRAGISCARDAARDSGALVALDVGPLGKMVGWLGGIGFEEAVSCFSETVRIGAEAGADFILIETMNDIYELKAAVLAAKEACDLPVVATVVFDESGRMMSGSNPASVVALLEGLGVAALGINCSLGPAKMKSILPELVKYASMPVIVQPNAGMPRICGGKTVYNISPAEFAGNMKEMAQAGARGLGGCCGTTPEHIKALVGAIEGITPQPITEKNLTMISSATHALVIGRRPLIVGERINPTGKKWIKEALLAGEYVEIAEEGALQADAGADILDVNAGLPGIDEAGALEAIITELQMITKLPLQIDTSNPAAMERALRAYCGVPLINSVSGKSESLASVLPLAKKYGGVLVGLTLDDDGIPTDVAGRLKIAEKIISEAKKYGISPKNIVIDPLAMSVSANPSAALTTLKTVAALSEMGIHTLLGISNVSYGLPMRDTLNSSFFTMALYAGLSLAIVNPNSAEIQKAYRAYLALSGKDENFSEFINFATNAAKSEAGSGQAASAPAPVAPAAGAPIGANGAGGPGGGPSELYHAIVRGMEAAAQDAAVALLKTHDALEVINGHIIPALGWVGEEFEKKRIFLPQLLMSAGAATAAFGQVRATMRSGCGTKGKIILATVKGDIHDIGKNIVKLLLENYDYEVIDLGRDVSYETILKSTRDNNVRLVGLSALMTTTLPAMEQTIKVLRQNVPDCRIMVGGAVLTEEYAKSIGADYYAPDATSAVRIAEKVFGHGK